MLLINKFFKRLFDLCSSSIAIIILIPLWIIIAILIKLDSKGPVFFKQKRRTIHGKVFNIYKFRSMIVNAENQGPGIFNFKDDKRITKIGKFLRNSSIDELPQLLNILKGDMSVVGPRPCVINELGDFDTLNKKYSKRFMVKAGLTGLAQVMGRNDISWDEKVTYDNQYVDAFKKQGILIDIKILFMSIFKVLKKENVYEKKFDESVDDTEAARIAEEEIIRIAHLPDEEDTL